MDFAIDTETTGLDIKHGCRPFLVTACPIGSNEAMWWEWEVDPESREVQYDPDDLKEIRELIQDADRIYMHNAQFDVEALLSIPGLLKEWDWAKTQDTTYMAHLLASSLPKNLEFLSQHYLNFEMGDPEETLRLVVNKCRNMARSNYPDWQIAEKGHPQLPTTSGKLWKADMWLPAAIAKQEGRDPDDEYFRLCSDYANLDSAVTAALVPIFQAQIKERKLRRIYRERLKLLPIVAGMQTQGITISGERLELRKQEYAEEAERLGKVCVGIAKSMGYDLVLPKSGNNKSLVDFVFDVLELEPIAFTPKGMPSLNKRALQEYLEVLPPRKKAHRFLLSLIRKRQRDTAVTYLEGYKRFWLKHEEPGWYVLYPSLNVVATNTLRWSSSHPNEQNISKQEGFNLRYCFGPAPGREWWSFDAKNIELRLPAYEAGEYEMIQLFERPNDPPYFGSNHLLAAHVIHPRRFEECVNEEGEIDGRIFKSRYASSYYQWTKNGNFAVQYGATESSGTADRAYHVQGAQRKIRQRFKRIARLNRRMINYAESWGYVETIPDRTVDPHRGYPVQCLRNEFSRSKPTIPLNYHIQGTAMWWMMKAMIRCEEYLQELRAQGIDAYMVMQVHDELVFDFPAAPPEYSGDRKRYNRRYVAEIIRRMEHGGDDLGIPTPVSAEYHPNNWSESE